MRHRIEIVERSLRYSAYYVVEDGMVKVESAYGSPSGPEGKDPKAQAEMLLREAIRNRRP